jgi:hypothetical protein
VWSRSPCPRRRLAPPLKTNQPESVTVHHRQDRETWPELDTCKGGTTLYPSVSSRGLEDVPVQDEWSQKRATLSDKTARKEFGLTQDEIEAAIDAGQLQYRVGVIHGNPWLRRLRREVEDLMKSTHNDRDHRQRRVRAELARVDRDLKKLRSEVRTLEEQRARLIADVKT